MIKNRLPFVQAICYSGYRDGQSPDSGEFPSYDQVKQDLLILREDWKSLRLYGSDSHSKTILHVIENEQLPFDVMLGAYITGEVCNENCPWGGLYSEEQLRANKQHNEQQIAELIALANRYPTIISSVSIGNEAAVAWTDHLVPIESLINYAQQTKSLVAQPVTFCENYVPWLENLRPLADELDVISIHTYPVWEFKSIDEGLAYTIANYQAVQDAYPDKQIIITEAGWATNSNGHGIESHNVNETFQQQYFDQLMHWAQEQKILVYFFEAFDENWKGSPDPMEPEKHWGIYNADRTPKLVTQS